MSIFRGRRDELRERAPGSAIVIFSHPESTRNSSVGHPYRPDSNLYYLSGWEEPESVMVLRPGQTPEAVLFVRPKNPERETWDGFRYGPEAAAKEFALDQVFLISELDAKLPELLKSVDRVYYRFNIDAENDRRFLTALEASRRLHSRTGRGYLPIYDSWELIGEMRVKKSEYEIKTMREACEISAQAHLEVMRSVKPGLNERTIHGLFVQSCLRQGARREGYNTIVASGANSTTLHYVFNDCPLRAGELLLVDAGAEYEYYTGDITRTYPISGKFSEPQRRFYQAVLDVQKRLLMQIKPGLAFASLQKTAIDLLVDAMIDLKLVSGSRSQVIESLEYRKYYPHGVSHWLGLDVHDQGLYVSNGDSRTLEPGMTFTVEPGLYVSAADTQVPAEYLGLGVRIEDDVLVTESGCEVLTASAPKEIAELEKVIGSRP